MIRLLRPPRINQQKCFLEKCIFCIFCIFYAFNYAALFFWYSFTLDWYFGLIRGESSARHLRKCPAISCCPVQQAVVVGCTYSALFMSVLGQSAVKWTKEMFRGRKLGIIKTRTSRRVNFCTTTWKRIALPLELLYHVVCYVVSFPWVEKLAASA